VAPAWHGVCELFGGQVSRDLNPYEKGAAMLSWAITFLVIALIAALFGFTGIAAGATTIAQVLFGLFLLLFLISLIAGLVRRPLP
jgi:uncharacterized membrane protein YtjA (UPF0391 family)